MKKIIIEKVHTGYIAAGALGILILIWIVFSSLGTKSLPAISAGNSGCDNPTTVNEIVRGSSMVPILVGGQSIEVLPSANPCFTIARDDIVIYDYARDLSDRNPVVKRVVGMGGDSFAYLSGNVFINGEKLQTSIGIDYTIESKILELYANDYPIIPNGKLLIFGEIPTGSKDSSTFGFVDVRELSGKVFIPTKSQ